MIKSIIEMLSDELMINVTYDYIEIYIISYLISINRQFYSNDAILSLVITIIFF